jgi:endonuclease/exonuclease/phosphatase family metal-dependent hydrolase
MRIMTLNINQYVAKHGPWIERRKLIVEGIKTADPDVVALQAVCQDIQIEHGEDQAEQIAEILGDYPYVYFQPAGDEKGTSYGSAFISRIPIYETGFLPLRTPLKAEDPTKRVVFYARLKNSINLTLFNAHFSYSDAQNKNNLKEALPFLKSFPGPALLVGDFNATPDKGMHSELTKLGWQDIWQTLHPRDPGYTFESQNPTLRIDYIWANADLKNKAKQIQILKGQTPKVRWSDHWSLLVDL